MKTNRTLASAIMWITYLIVVGLSIQALGAWSILLAFVLMMPLLGAMGIMWSNGNVSVYDSNDGFTIETEEEKRKAIPMDSVLNDLSHDDFDLLREQILYCVDEEIYFRDDEKLRLGDH